MGGLYDVRSWEKNDINEVESDRDDDLSKFGTFRLQKELDRRLKIEEENKVIREHNIKIQIEIDEQVKVLDNLRRKLLKEIHY